MTKIAINGLGRIGRAALKAILAQPQLEIVAVNDVLPAYQLAYLLNFDNLYGKSDLRFEKDDHHLYVNGRTIKVLNIPDPLYLPWGDLGVEMVLECTGKFTFREELEKHILAGARNVMLSAPANSDNITTIVHGVNHPVEEKELEIVSAASCTSNCVAPIVEVLGRRVGVRKAILSSLNSYTAKEGEVDDPCRYLRLGRAGAYNFIPSKTAAARATSKVLPQFYQKISGLAIRGPILVGAMADITLVMERQTSIEEINHIFCEEAGSDRYRNILGVNTEPIVSSDIIKDPRASVVDLSMTQVVDGDLVKVISWYDNEWGYVNQMVKEIKRIARVKEELALAGQPPKSEVFI